MDIRQLECFVAVAEELHFRRASVRLGLSQPALSERVSALEHELGARLFFRTTRQVSLTQAGSEFLQDAKRILSDIEKSVSNVIHTAESDLHNVRVSGVDEAICSGGAGPVGKRRYRGARTGGPRAVVRHRRHLGDDQRGGDRRPRLGGRGRATRRAPPRRARRAGARGRAGGIRARPARRQRASRQAG